MAERGSRKIPVTEREFLWVQDDDKGEVVLHVGATMVSPTAADRVVIDDGLGGFKEDPLYRPQKMIELSDSQYAVLYNPLLELDAGSPNGRFKPGRNESRPLKNGTRSMIAGPTSFCLRPGQRCEERDAHELASNQYLVVKVYGEVDKAAPYYEVTRRSAGIKEATAAQVGATNLGGKDLKDASDPLTRGQLIVIRGLDTQFYIPPTGVDIVPDTSSDGAGSEVSAEQAIRLIRELEAQAPAKVAAPAAPPAPPMQIEVQDYGNINEEEMSQGRFEEQSNKRKGAPPIQQAARFRQRAAQPAPEMNAPGYAASQAAPQALPAIPVNLLAESEALQKALRQKAAQLRLVREAVVLGEKEFCVISDADGKRKIHVGPARVFPGPYDQFQTVGSRNRVYDAYELLPQRALWLRVISTIDKLSLQKKLPKGFVLEKETYYPGDEILLTGVSGFFFPFNEIEVLSPETGMAVIGNDHSRVFIEAIGIDQKSGIYVRDLTTGEVRLVRGKQTYLVDPRREIHITRNVSARQWNLWIAAGEEHKRTSKSIVTPWAISIVVPHKTAVMAASADGLRVIEGPCVSLLHYEETLVPLTLSTGTPKTEDTLIETCYLRTAGNRVSDRITLETADFVEFNVRVSYRVHFDPAMKERWFNHPNFIQVLVEHLRSRLRGRCRNESLGSLWPRLSDTIRDVVLGEKTDKGRRGCVFPENGMVVSEVEILSAEIVDKKISGLMVTAQSELVALQIADRKAKEELASKRLRADLEAQRLKLEEMAAKNLSELDKLRSALAKDSKLAAIRAEAESEREAMTLKIQKEVEETRAQLEKQDLVFKSSLTRVKDEAEIKAEAARVGHQEDVEYKAILRDLEVRLIEAQSKAVVEERKAVQPGLIEALSGLGDKILLSEVAQNMNLISLFKGKDIGSIFSEILGGTAIMPTVRKMIDRSGGKE